jgi:hypothetical protein
MFEDMFCNLEALLGTRKDHVVSNQSWTICRKPCTTSTSTAMIASGHLGLTRKRREGAERTARKSAGLCKGSEKGERTDRELEKTREKTMHAKGEKK